MDLSRVATREKLKPRREPYYQTLATGRRLGYRVMTKGSTGNWVARYRDTVDRRYFQKPLGDYGHLPPNKRFSAAKVDAEKWFEQVAIVGATKAHTVRAACEDYAESRPEAAARFKRHVYDDPIAKIPLEKLTQSHVKAWRKRLEEKEVRRTGASRTASALNRDMTAFRAALNAAFDANLVISDLAWRAILKPVKNADRRRNVYLSRNERKELLKHLPDDAGAFVRGLCLLPLRPGALAALKVGDFDSRTGELIIAKDKAGHVRKILLPPATAALLKEQSRDKLPTAPLFTRADGRQWNKDAWKSPLKEAATVAKLPPATSAYVLRHSVITDLVADGLPILTVAQVSGTSVAMIERFYGHLQQKQAAAALAKLVL